MAKKDELATVELGRKIMIPMVKAACRCAEDLALTVKSIEILLNKWIRDLQVDKGTVSHSFKYMEPDK